MKVKSNILLILLLLAGYTAQSSEDVQTFLKSVNAQYSRAYTSNFRVKLMDGSMEKVSKSGYVKTNPKTGDFIVSYAEVKSIKSGQESVMINSTAKSVYYQSEGDHDAQGADFGASALIDSLINAQASKLRLEKLSNGKTRLIHADPSKDIAEAQYIFSGTTLVEVIYYYTDKTLFFDKVVINYSNVKFADRWPSSDFTLGGVVTKNGSQLKLTSAYNGYQLINANDLRWD